MRSTKKPSAKEQAASRPDIQECPAFEKCREKAVSCDVCRELSVEAWREHVKNVMAMS
jgi:hypothetical protein